MIESQNKVTMLDDGQTGVDEEKRGSDDQQRGRSDHGRGHGTKCRNHGPLAPGSIPISSHLPLPCLRSPSTNQQEIQT